MATTTRAAQPQVNLQGAMVPQSAINPQLFMALTRRLSFQNKSITFGGLGAATDFVEIPKVGILSAVTLQFDGTLTVTLNGGTVATTGLWPYDFVSRFRFAANGLTNLINASGWHIKAREIMQRGDLNDRAITRGVGGASPGTQITSGSLSLANENWGVGQGVTAIAGGTYAVQLSFKLPIAHDDVYLTGAVLAQTSATDLTINIDYAPLANLFITTGSPTIALTGAWSVQPTAYSIPSGPDGGVVLPDLSHLHSLVQSQTSSIQNAENEIRLAGQGVGRQTMRMWFRTINGATRMPLAMNATNYGNVAWRYGSNDTPEVYPSGRSLAVANERMFGNDMGGLEGFGIFDFVNENAFRDTVDQGAATELRLVATIQSGVTLSNPQFEYVQELLVPGAVSAAA